MATAETSGVQAGAGAGIWQIWATSGTFSPAVANPADGEAGFTRATTAGSTELCVVVATDQHQTDPSTAHCVALPA
jgi:hypothetical protein